MVRYATLGIDRQWKRRIISYIPPGSRRVLDFACGTGILTLAIAEAYPTCYVVGVELRDEYLAIAQRKARERRIENINWILSRAEDYRPAEPFDCVVSSYLAKYADLTRLTANTKEMMKDGGLVLMHDFTFPPKPHLVRLWRLYFWLMQRTAGLLFPAWREIYYGLPRLIEEAHWVPELTDTLRQQQFQDIHLEYLTLYGSAIITARKPGRATAS
jgi:demethylmenaquinone methyltransferase/2-methoxy-6-polyprenyl-1,4-benzoquinol methylase